MNTNSRHLLIIGAGPTQVPAIDRARAMGLRVTVTDRNPDSDGFALAHAHGVVSTRDVAATIAFARATHATHPIHGVMTIASESAVTVAAVAADLGLPGVDVATAERATNKVLRQERFASAGVPAPRFARAETLDEAVATGARLGWPVVAKPADSAGSRGVRKVPDADAMADAVAEIRTVSARPELLIEEFLTGTEHSIEGLVVDGQTHWTAFSDRNYAHKERHPPYFLEDGDTLPTDLSADVLRAAEDAANRAVTALGIGWGPVKGDILVDAAGPKVLEMAARLSGDHFATDTAPLHNGVDLVDATIDLAIGRRIDLARLRPIRAAGVALRYVWPRPGRVTSISGIAEARSAPGVAWVRFEPRWRDLAPGTVITPARAMGERVASILASGATRSQAVSRAEHAVGLVRIETEPVT